MTRLFSLALLTIGLTALTGCEAISHLAGSIAPGKVVSANPEPVMYPDATPVGAPLDIEVVRVDRRTIRIDNRTPRSYDGGMIYLNHEYGAPLPTIPIGATNHIALVDFVNEHGERFPVGSFLEPEKAKKLVLADLVIDGKIHKLTMRLEPDWQALQ